MMTLWRTEKRDSHMCVTRARSWVLPLGFILNNHISCYSTLFKNLLSVPWWLLHFRPKFICKGLFEEQQIARNSLQRILMFVYSHSKKLCHHTIGVINNTLPGTTTFHSAIFKNTQVCSGDFCTAKDCKGFVGRASNYCNYVDWHGNSLCTIFEKFFVLAEIVLMTKTMCFRGTCKYPSCFIWCLRQKRVDWM